MTAEDMAMAPGKEPTRRLFVQNATESAKFRLSPAGTVRYIAAIAFQSAKKEALSMQTGITGLKEDTFPGNTVPIKDNLEKGRISIKRRSHFLHVEKNVFNIWIRVAKFAYPYCCTMKNKDLDSSELQKTLQETGRR